MRTTHFISNQRYFLSIFYNSFSAQKLQYDVHKLVTLTFHERCALLSAALDTGYFLSSGKQPLAPLYCCPFATRSSHVSTCLFVRWLPRYRSGISALVSSPLSCSGGNSSSDHNVYKALLIVSTKNRK